jgi:hypothetical protein
MASRRTRAVATAPTHTGHDVPTRRFTVLAQDPTVTGPGGRALTTLVTVPAERLEGGPKGHRVHVIDYDASTDAYYRPRNKGLVSDPYRDVTDLDQLVRDPHFHQQNVYAIAMATLGMGNGSVFQLVPQRFRREIGAATGIIGAAGGLGGFLLLSLLGTLKDLVGTYGAGFWCLSAFGASCLILLLALRSRWLRSLVPVPESAPRPAQPIMTEGTRAGGLLCGGKR